MNNSARIRSFTELRKDTIGETYKCLNILLRELNNNVDSLQPLISTEELSAFDESLKFIILNSCQLRDEVSAILLNQNNYQIKRALNFNWFFASPENTEEFCHKVFPNVSTWLRNKLINKFSRAINRPEDAEILFKYTKEHYSRAQAELFLGKCSSSFIQKYFTEEKPLFQHSKSSRVLLTICMRDPSLVISLFTAALSNKGGPWFEITKHRTVLLFLASNHTDIFIPFFNQFYSKLLFLKFGKKLSKKIGPRVKDLVMEKSELFKSSVFKKPALFSVLNLKDQVSFLSSVVIFEANSLSFFNWVNNAYQFKTFLNIVKPENRLHIIETTFNQVYGLSVWNHMELCEPQILEVIPLHARIPCVEAYEKQVGASWITRKDKSPFYEGMENWPPLSDPENYVYLYPFERAFPVLKKILSRTPTLYGRQGLLDSMVNNCAVNKDIAHLEEVVKYITTRFRNDSSTIYMDLLHNVFRSFPLKLITPTVMHQLEEALQLCFIKNEANDFESLLENCMLHRLDNNLTVADQVKQLVDWCITRNMTRYPFLRHFKAQHSRQLFFHYYAEILLRMKEASSNLNKLESLTVWVLDTLKAYNRRNKRNTIPLSLLPDLVPYVIALIKKRSKGVIDDINSVIDFTDSVSIFLIENSPEKIIRWALKRRPQTVLGTLQCFITYILSDYHINSRTKALFHFSVNIFSFFGVLPQLTQSLTEKFQSSDSGQTKKNALTIISHLCTLEDFSKLVKDYMPTGEQIDRLAGTQFAEVQLLVPRLIKNLMPSWKNIQFIFNFFIGDFFPQVLTSFYACSYRTRVDSLIPMLLDYLHNLSARSKIAFKKELVRVLLNVSDAHQVLEICMECWHSTDHYSVRTIVLKKASSAFLECPGRDRFRVLLKFIEESDELVISGRPRVHQISAPFFADYISVLWNFSEKQEAMLKNEIRNSIIADLREGNIGLLPKDFCHSLIEENLFKGELEVKGFTSYYLIANAAAMEERVRFFFEIMKKSEVEDNVISDFLKILKSITLKNCAFALNLFENLLKHWPFEDKTRLYMDRLILEYHYMYGKIWSNLGESAVDEKSEEFGRELSAFFCRHTHLVYLTGVFGEGLNIFLSELRSHGRTLNEIAAFRALLKSSGDACLAILVVTIVSADRIKLYRAKGRTFNAVETKSRNDTAQLVDLLKGYQHEVVDIYLKKRFGV